MHDIQGLRPGGRPSRLGRVPKKLARVTRARARVRAPTLPSEAPGGHPCDFLLEVSVGSRPCASQSQERGSSRNSLEISLEGCVCLGVVVRGSQSNSGRRGWSTNGRREATWLLLTLLEKRLDFWLKPSLLHSRRCFKPSVAMTSALVCVWPPCHRQCHGQPDARAR